MKQISAAQWEKILLNVPVENIPLHYIKGVVVTPYKGSKKTLSAEVFMNMTAEYTKEKFKGIQVIIALDKAEEDIIEMTTELLQN